jgi:hypothetical protein
MFRHPLGLKGIDKIRRVIFFSESNQIAPDLVFPNLVPSDFVNKLVVKPQARLSSPACLRI